MSVKCSTLCLVVALSLTFLAARCPGQIENPSSENPVGPESVTKYATDKFFAGCRIRPKPLFADPYFGSLPFHRYLPEPVSLGRLNALDVEEFVVFCGPATGKIEDAEWNDGIQWAAAGRMSNPIELKAVMRRWRESLVPREKSAENEPVAIRIADRDCFRVLAGSFFPPPRRYGKLRFTDRDGQPAKEGVNVGNINEYRGYVEGDTKASAIFTLDGIDDGDLVDGQLPLELRFAVFLTQDPGREFTMAQIQLRNPNTGLRSDPVQIEAKSYVNRRLNFPRRLTAIDAKGKRQADLFQDFVSGGRLEVVLKGTAEGIYLGVGAHSLSLHPQAFEFVSVNDRELVIAQTPEILKAMLQYAAKPAALSKRLSQQAGEIVIAANIRQNEDRKALKHVARLIGNGSIARHWASTLTELTGIVRLDQAPMAQVTSKFTRRSSAEKASRLCRERIRELQSQVRQLIGERIEVVDTMANLATVGLDGIAFTFPGDQFSPTEEFKLEYQRRNAEFLKIIDEVFDGIQMESERNVLTIQFTRPRSLSSLSKPAKYTWAKTDESLARDLLNLEKFDLADEVFQRVTDRCPEVPGAWFRRAWHLSYNVTPKFDGYEARYVWVRRGINVLLDGAEQNPGSTDMLWMAARFIGRKIGESDDSKAFRKLFSKDEQLHERLAKYIDLEETRSPGEKIDNWLVAKLLFEHCIEREKGNGAPSTLPPLLFYSRPAATQARYADSLAQSGRWKEARHAWKEAERLHKELGETKMPLPKSKRMPLDELKARRARFGPDDPTVKALEVARRFIQYDYWLTRCRFEQTDEFQSARKLKHEADEHAKQSEWKQAIKGYRNSLEILAEIEKRHPEEMALLAGDFSEIAAGHRKACKHVEAVDGQPLESLLELIETSYPRSTWSLIVDPKYYRKSPIPE